MAWHLVVVSPFGDYVRGQEITDPKTVTEILEGEDNLRNSRLNKTRNSTAPQPPHVGD